MESLQRHNGLTGRKASAAQAGLERPLDLVTVTPAGLYCPAGDFHVDPHLPVPRAVLTHAHADHARRGAQRYLVAAPGRALAALRLGEDADIEAIPYGQPLRLGAVTVSLHPAGHVLGAAQVRMEHHGQVCVISGDYKLASDPTCAPFEPVRCHTFITESTFGLPVYRWPAVAEELGRLHEWWRDNQAAGRTSLVLAYSLGKAQRLLALLDASIGPMAVHPAVAPLNAAYRAGGARLPEVPTLDEQVLTQVRSRGLVIAPPSAGLALKRRLGPCAVAAASGWMLVRGQRRRQGLDAGFVISDHADWPGLHEAISASGATTVAVTHGYVHVMVRHLQERGLNAVPLTAGFTGDAEAE